MGLTAEVLNLEMQKRSEWFRGETFSRMWQLMQEGDGTTPNATHHNLVTCWTREVELESSSCAYLNPERPCTFCSVNETKYGWPFIAQVLRCRSSCRGGIVPCSACRNWAEGGCYSAPCHGHPLSQQGLDRRMHSTVSCPLSSATGALGCFVRILWFEQNREKAS